MGDVSGDGLNWDTKVIVGIRQSNYLVVIFGTVSAVMVVVVIPHTMVNYRAKALLSKKYQSNLSLPIKLL